jgi:pimeloyl-ACP methyl ester carboxylesterase
VEITGLARTVVDGIPVAYRRAGAGPALVLLHGFTQDSRVWRRQIDDFASRFTVIAWDAPGAGQSADPPETYSIDDWADCLAAVLDHAGVRRAHVVGLSWGGIVAQVFSARHPERVRSLVLADTYAGLERFATRPGAAGASGRVPARCRPAARRVRPAVSAGDVRPVAAAEARDELAAIMAEFHPAGFRLMAASSAQADTRGLLPVIRVPTLLVWGEADARSPLSVGYQMRDAVPGARLVVLPGAGHVSNMEAPGAFNAAVSEFCLSI